MDVSPLVIGHRGAPGYRPEHSASSYRLAFAMGVDAVEPDVVATRDGVLVIRHENEISGTTDVADHPEFADRRCTKLVDGQRLTGWFTEDFTWAELQTLRCIERLPRVRPENRRFDRTERILRLRDLLELIDAESARLGREIGLVLEIKHAAYFASIGIPLAPLVRRELARSGWDARPGRLVVESFELGILHELGELRADGVRMVFLLEQRGTPADAPAGPSFRWYRSPRGLDRLASLVDGVSVDTRALLRRRMWGRVGSTPLVERAHERGLLVYTWTLRPENRSLPEHFRSSREPAEWGDWLGLFGMLLGTGVDGIFVDHPDLGIAARSDARARGRASRGA